MLLNLRGWSSPTSWQVVRLVTLSSPQCHCCHCSFFWTWPPAFTWLLACPTEGSCISTLYHHTEKHSLFPVHLYLRVFTCPLLTPVMQAVPPHFSHWSFVAACQTLVPPACFLLLVSLLAVVHIPWAGSLTTLWYSSKGVFCSIALHSLLSTSSLQPLHQAQLSSPELFFFLIQDFRHWGLSLYKNDTFHISNTKDRFGFYTVFSILLGDCWRSCSLPAILLMASEVMMTITLRNRQQPWGSQPIIATWISDRFCSWLYF